MEVMAHNQDTISMRTQNYQYILREAIHRIEQTEKVLQERVDQEIKTLIMKHTHIQTTLNK